MDSVSQDPTTSAQVCYRHPDRQTLLSCSRCGRAICAACSTDAAVGQRCPECLRDEGTQETIRPTTRRRGGVLQGLSRQGPVTFALIIINVGVFILGSLSPDVYGWLIQNLAHINASVAQGEWWRMVTVTLVHGGITHILFNMWALAVLGPQVERGVGRGPFLALYLGAAAMGSAFAFHLGRPGDIGVGASGAIFGLFGIWLAWAIQRRNSAYGRYVLNQLGFLLLINAALPFLIRNISWQAHLGGLLAGLFIGMIWGRLRGGSATQNRTTLALAVGAIAVISTFL